MDENQYQQTEEQKDYESDPLLNVHSSSSSSNSFKRPAKRGVNALQLTMMIYFFTSGCIIIQSTKHMEIMFCY